MLASATERVALANSTQVANFTDSDLTDLLTGFTATIDWGDGTTSPGTITGSNGSFSVLGGHSYSDEGNFTLSATIVRSADNATFTDTGNIAVAEHDVLAAQGTTIIGNPGTLLNNVSVATFTDTDTAAVAGDFQAIVDWGDATTSPGTITGSNGSFAVSGSHTYAFAGQDTITVTVVRFRTRHRQYGRHRRGHHRVERSGVADDGHRAGGAAVEHGGCQLHRWQSGGSGERLYRDHRLGATARPRRARSQGRTDRSRSWVAGTATPMKAISR